MPLLFYLSSAGRKAIYSYTISILSLNLAASKVIRQLSAKIVTWFATPTQLDSIRDQIVKVKFAQKKKGGLSQINHLTANIFYLSIIEAKSQL